MTREPDGSISFSRGGARYSFETANYKTHCARHPKIQHDKHLLEIEEAIFDPDAITQAKKRGRQLRNQKIFYKVKSYSHQRRGILVTVWKVVTFLKRKGGTVATAFELNAFNDQLFHYLETIIWKKPNSLI